MNFLFQVLIDEGYVSSSCAEDAEEFMVTLSGFNKAGVFVK